MTEAKTFKQRSMKTGELIVKVLTYIALSFFALIILVPFMVVVLTSFKTFNETLQSGFTWGFKDGISIEGYKALFDRNTVASGTNMHPLLLSFINTLIIVLPSTFLGLLASAISAYAFAKINFPLKKQLFGFLLMTMMLPYIITVAPSYIIFDYLQLTNTKFPLMVPGMFGAAACVFFMRQFYTSIPTDLVEAAKIDGSNHFGIFFRIMVPLSMSALIAQAVLGFLGGYNDFFAPVLYLHTEDQYTLQVYLSLMQGSYGTSEWPTIMAGALVALAPTIILYIFAQRYFIEGIATSGLKV